MSTEVVYLGADSPMHQAMRIMLTRGFRHIPIIIGGNVVGVVTMFDLVKHVASSGSLEDPLIRAKSSEPLIVEPGLEVTRVVDLMINNNVDYALVVGRGELGIVTERDLVRMIPLSQYPRVRVYDVMSTNPVTLSQESTVRDCVNIMMTYRIRHIPITHGGRVAGVVSIRDVARVIMRSHDEEGRINWSLNVDEFMSHNPITVDPGATLAEAVLAMRRHNVGSLLVVELGELLGIITERDVTRRIVIRGSMESSAPAT